MNKPLKLDRTQLLGFKLLRDATAKESTVGAKVGKVAAPPAGHVTLGAKVGKQERPT